MLHAATLSKEGLQMEQHNYATTRSWTTSSSHKFDPTNHRRSKQRLSSQGSTRWYMYDLIDLISARVVDTCTFLSAIWPANTTALGSAIVHGKRINVWSILLEKDGQFLQCSVWSQGKVSLLFLHQFPRKVLLLLIKEAEGTGILDGALALCLCASISIVEHGARIEFLFSMCLHCTVV